MFCWDNAAKQKTFRVILWFWRHYWLQTVQQNSQTDEYDFWKWQLHYCYHPLITSLVISERNESRRWQTNAALISIFNRPDVNWAENEPGGQRDKGRRFVTDEWKTAGWERGRYRGACEKLWINKRVVDLGGKFGQWRLHYNICEEPAESLRQKMRETHQRSPNWQSTRMSFSEAL